MIEWVVNSWPENFELILIGEKKFFKKKKQSLSTASSETQGQSVRPGEKSRWKFASTGGRAPGYRLSPDHFQMVKRILAPDWAQKMLCIIIVPNRQTVCPEFFSWVRTRRPLSCHSCPVHSPSFPIHKWKHYRWVEKRFGCYQQKQINLHRENSVSDGSWCIVNNGTFKTQQRRESKKKAIAWRGKTTTLHVQHAFVNFFAITARLPVKTPNFTFCEGRKQAMTKFSVC